MPFDEQDKKKMMQPEPPECCSAHAFEWILARVESTYRETVGQSNQAKTDYLLACMKTNTAPVLGPYDAAIVKSVEVAEQRIRDFCGEVGLSLLNRRVQHLLHSPDVLEFLREEPFANQYLN